MYCCDIHDLYSTGTGLRCSAIKTKWLAGTSGTDARFTEEAMMKRGEKAGGETCKEESVISSLYSLRYINNPLCALVSPLPLLLTLLSQTMCGIFGYCSYLKPKVSICFSFLPSSVILFAVRVALLDFCDTHLLPSSHSLCTTDEQQLTVFCLP